MIDSTITIIYIAFGLGMLHALDADHILTITGISARKNQWQQVMRYSLHWAIGHSFSLLIIGVSIFLLGSSFNESFSMYAEIIVATVLAAIGFNLLLNAKQKLPHTESSVKENFQSSHKALAIGSIHGIAGTASILALIPVTKISDPYLALSYLVIFSIGILISMMLFGGVLRHSIKRLIHYYPRSIVMVQMVAGVLAIIFSANLLIGFMG